MTAAGRGEIIIVTGIIGRGEVVLFFGDILRRGLEADHPHTDAVGAFRDGLGFGLGLFLLREIFLLRGEIAGHTVQLVIKIIFIRIRQEGILPLGIFGVMAFGHFGHLISSRLGIVPLPSSRGRQAWAGMWPCSCSMAMFSTM